MKGRAVHRWQIYPAAGPGVYYWWKNNITIVVAKVDTRALQIEINGQEILTKDKGRFAGERLRPVPGNRYRKGDPPEQGVRAAVVRGLSAGAAGVHRYTGAG